MWYFQIVVVPCSVVLATVAALVLRGPERARYSTGWLACSGLALGLGPALQAIAGEDLREYAGLDVLHMLTVTAVFGLLASRSVLVAQHRANGRSHERDGRKGGLT